MALFFDQAWFDARLKGRGLTHEDVARVLQVSIQQVAELWKDQRELRAHEVSAIAKLLNAPASEIAHRAGVSTPTPRESGDITARLDEMNDRLQRVERMMVELKTLILTPRS